MFNKLLFTTLFLFLVQNIFGQTDEKNKILFYVQVSSNSRPISEDSPILNKVLQRGYNYDYVSEYNTKLNKQIYYYLVPLGGLTDRDEAILLKNKLEIKNSFVVPTLNRKKITLDNQQLLNYLKNYNKGLGIKRANDVERDNTYNPDGYIDKTNFIEKGMINKYVYYLQIGAYLDKKLKNK